MVLAATLPHEVFPLVHVPGKTRPPQLGRLSFFRLCDAVVPHVPDAAAYLQTVYVYDNSYLCSAQISLQTFELTLIAEDNVCTPLESM